MYEVKSICCGAVICEGYNYSHAVERGYHNRVSFKYADLAGVNLGVMNLCEGDFSYACFREARLRHVAFRRAHLEGANFHEAQLSFADFRGADLRNTTFDYADLPNAKFQGACLSMASIRFANVAGANFEGAIIDGLTITGSNRELAFGL